MYTTTPISLFKSGPKKAKNVLWLEIPLELQTQNMACIPNLTLKIMKMGSLLAKHLPIGVYIYIYIYILILVEIPDHYFQPCISIFFCSSVRVFMVHG